MVTNRQGHCANNPLRFAPTSVWRADPDRAQHSKMRPTLHFFFSFLSPAPPPPPAAAPSPPFSFCSLSNPGQLFLPLFFDLLPLRIHQKAGNPDISVWEESAKALPGSQAKPTCSTTAFPKARTRVCEQLVPKCDFGFHSVSVPPVFCPLRRRGDFRAGFGVSGFLVQIVSIHLSPVRRGYHVAGTVLSRTSRSPHNSPLRVFLLLVRKPRFTEA